MTWFPSETVPYQTEPPTPVSRTEKELLELILGKLGELPTLLRQSEADRLWAAISTYVFEKNYTLSAASLTITAQHGEFPILVQYITGYSSTAGATQVAGTLQLGDWQTPVGPGLFNLRPMLILTKSDVRSLTVPTANAGAMSLLLAGVPLPMAGVLPR